MIQLPLFAARKSAQALRASIADPDQQWSVEVAERYLPHGWKLRGAEDGDFMPATVANMTAAFRRFAVRER